MKKLIVLFSLLVSLSASASPSAQSELWSDIHDFLMKCAVQPYAVQPSGQKIYAEIRSVCSELRVRGNTAFFVLDGRSFFATAVDSRYSDDGDLNDVRVRDARGNIIAERTHVLAFGDVLLALNGGDNNFRQVYDPSILLR